MNNFVAVSNVKARNVLGVCEWNSVAYKGQKCFSSALLHSGSGIQPHIKGCREPLPQERRKGHDRVEYVHKYLQSLLHFHAIVLS
jgi:hypothetical protein